MAAVSPFRFILVVIFGTEPLHTKKIKAICDVNKHICDQGICEHSILGEMSLLSTFSTGSIQGTTISYFCIDHTSTHNHSSLN